MAPELTQTTTAKSAVTLTKPSPRVNGDRANVTFLAGNGDYVKGVAKGLRKVKCAYPLVVAILPDVPEEHRRILVEQGCIVGESDMVNLKPFITALTEAGPVKYVTAPPAA